MKPTVTRVRIRQSHDSGDSNLRISVLPPLSGLCLSGFISVGSTPTAIGCRLYEAVLHGRFARKLALSS